MKHNFGAGPGILPHEVLKQAAAGVIDLNGIGLSILEISHRSAEFESILDEAVRLVKELLGVPEGYSVLFMQGGASTQFALAPYNLLPEGGKAAYLETGVWANKALKEAKYFGDVEIVATSKESNFTYIPKDFKIPARVAVRDPETGRVGFLSPRSQGAVQEAKRFRDQQLRLLTVKGADRIEIQAGQNVVTPLIGFFRKRLERMGRR